MNRTKRLRNLAAVLMTVTLLMGIIWIPREIQAQDGGVSIAPLSFSKVYKQTASEPIIVTNNSGEEIKIDGFNLSGSDASVFWVLQASDVTKIPSGQTKTVGTININSATKVRMNSSGDEEGAYAAVLHMNYTKGAESATASVDVTGKVKRHPITFPGQALLTKNTKEYDGNTSLDTSTYNTGALTSIFAGDSVTLAEISADFDSPNAGENKEITLHYQWTGQDAYNYELPLTGSAKGNIRKAPGNVEFRMENIPEASSVNYVLKSGTNNVNDAVITYKLKGAPDTAYTETSPAEAGLYVARVVIPQSQNYKEVTAESEFVVYSRNSDLSIAAGQPENVYGYTGGTAAVTLQNKSSSNLKITSCYLDQEGAQSFSVQGSSLLDIMGPNEVDRQTVKITLKDNLVPGHYNGSLMITYEKNGITYFSQGQIRGSVSKRPLLLYNALESKTKVYDGTTEAKTGPVASIGLMNGDNVSIKAEASYDTPDAGANKKITITYTAWGDHAGYYQIPDRETVYDGMIQKAEGKGTVTIDNVYRGQKIKPVLTSKTNDINKVTMYYKKSGNDGIENAFQIAEPNEAGIYKAKAVFAETANYQETIAETTFQITEMEADSSMYSIEGVMANNGFYTSDVVISGKNGYMVSTQEDGLYTTGLTITESRGPWNLYLKHNETGIRPKAVPVAELKIDKTAPKIKGVANGAQIKEGSLKITVTDPHLAQVLVNGRPWDFHGTQAVIAIEQQTKTVAYEIEASDQSGHVSKVQFIVKAKTNKISGSGIVTLEEGVEYQFDMGTFKIAGDNTIYRGNNVFYVYDTGQYNVIKQ